jgi:hypothetical protein
MKATRVPPWLLDGLVDRYQAGSSHLFLLHGNVRDLHPFGGEYVPLPDGLRRLLGRREVVVSYEVSSGLSFPTPGHEKAFRRALGLRPGPLPSDAARALVLLDALLTGDRVARGQVGVLIEYAHALVPSGPSGSQERQAVTMLARWASDPKLAERRPLVLLIAPSAGEVSEEIFAGASGAEVVAVPRPDLELRSEFSRHLREVTSDVTFVLTPEELGVQTGGLGLSQIEDVVERARAAGEPIDLGKVGQRKLELLRQEYSDVLEILEPRHGLAAVGGLDHAVAELREVSDILRRGLFTAAPMGLVLMGPPGTGKSYLAECFAKECGLLCVRTRPLRGMYVGQSERNQEKAFAAIRALAPVIVVVDESDQAEGGSRDAGGGDSGVGERMRAAAFNFWGDGTLRGKVLRIDITNRIDLIDAAMRRSGRTDVKIPILMPDAAARAQIFAVTFRKHKVQTEITDFAPFAERTASFTGSDIELVVTLAYRFAVREGATAVAAKHLTAALDDQIPQARDQATIDRMTLLALDECRNVRLLPRNHQQIRAEIAARSGG